MKQLIRLMVVLIGLTWLGPASATVFKLLDHPDAALTGLGSYGLRLDSLDDVVAGAIPGSLFSVSTNGASVTLTWDGVSDTALIAGRIYNHGQANLWDVTHLITGVGAVAGGFIATGEATSVLTLTDPGNTEFIYTSKQNGDGESFLFLDDSHRCGGHPGCGPIVGRGWFNASGTNDWLVQAVPVPEPMSLALLGSGLFGLGFNRRKKQH